MEPPPHPGRGNIWGGIFFFCWIGIAIFLSLLCKNHSQVKLLVNKENGEACAMKEVRMTNCWTKDWRLISWYCFILMLASSQLNATLAHRWTSASTPTQRSASRRRSVYTNCSSTATWLDAMAAGVQKWTWTFSKSVLYLSMTRCYRHYHSRCEGKRQFIFLEYLRQGTTILSVYYVSWTWMVLCFVFSGGELFDRITPDKGMEEWRAQRFVYITLKPGQFCIFCCCQVVQPIDRGAGVSA